MRINLHADWVILPQAGTISQIIIMGKMSNIELQPISLILHLVAPAEIADIIERGVSLAKSGNRKNCIEEIGRAIFEYFRDIADILNKALTDEKELPKIIDTLKNEGYIGKDVREKLLDFLLTLDGLRMQDEILDDDLDLLREISYDLKNQKISNFSDHGGNLPYLYADVTHIKALNGNTLLTRS